jgi:hypothetical protein
MFKIICTSILILLTINCSNFQNESKPIYENKKAFPLLLGAITFYSDSQFSKYALGTIDLSRYAGSWFEIERTPNSFQGELANVKATYSARSDGNVTVYNEGTFPSGSSSNITGVAVPSALPRAILKVSFFPGIFSVLLVIMLAFWGVFGEMPSMEELYWSKAVFSLSSLYSWARQASKVVAENGIDTFDIKISVLKYTESLV